MNLLAPRLGLLGSMSFRARLVLAAAGAVAGALAVASLVAYFIVRDKLQSQVDSGLIAEANRVANSPFLVTPGFRPNQFFVHVPRPELGGAGGYIQLVSGSGQTFRSDAEPVALPVSRRDLGIADGTASRSFRDVRLQGIHERILTIQARQGLALQVAQPLTQADDATHTIGLWLLTIAALGVAIAALLGLAVARAALGPVRRLTETAERISETRDLRRRMSVYGGDELSRLSASFNRMLDALADAARAQRQLIADASHELRTPLTSLRTNIEVLLLQQGHGSNTETLLRDVVEELAEMSALVSALVELARGDDDALAAEEIQFDALIETTVDSARRRWPGLAFETDLETGFVLGDRRLLERMVGNLIDNAAKWSPAAGVVETTLRDGEFMVRDQGPGIAEEDLPHIFDRFYRSAKARSLPGSGLGLAIVKHAVDVHGGTVVAESAREGGALLRVRLPMTTVKREDGARVQTLTLPE